MERIPHDQGKGERVLEFSSLSRPGVIYRAYPDHDYCPCPGKRSHGWCSHINCRHCKGYGTLVSYPKLVECPVCGGSGMAS